jgi:diguanylate cyclase (GGDEF)-like protein
MPDPLTGLPTHRDLLEIPPSTNRILALWVDIDGLIWVNDQFGFEAGHEAIREVADALQAVLGPFGASLYRVGGDEFLALLGETDETTALDLGTQIVEAIGRREIPYRRSDRTNPTHLQVNVAAFGIDEMHLLRSLGEHGLVDPIHGALADAIYESRTSHDTLAGVVVRVSFD